MIIVDWLKRVFRNNNKLHKFELDVINAVKNVLDDDAVNIIQNQIDNVRFVQRLSATNGKEVNLYLSQKNDDKLQFPFSDTQELFAKIFIVKSNELKILKVDLWLVNGRLFSLLFSEAPSVFYSGRSYKNIIPEIKDVKIWYNPIRTKNIYSNEFIKSFEFHGWLKEILPQVTMSELRMPLSSDTIKSYISRFDTKFPDDYLELVSQAEGVIIFNFCTILGLRSVNHVVTKNNCNAYIIAEVSGCGALVVKYESYTGDIFLWSNFDDCDEILVGTSLKEAINYSLNLMHKEHGVQKLKQEIL